MYTWIKCGSRPGHQTHARVSPSEKTDTYAKLPLGIHGNFIKYKKYPVPVELNQAQFREFLSFDFSLHYSIPISITFFAFSTSAQGPMDPDGLRLDSVIYTDNIYSNPSDLVISESRTSPWLFWHDND